jgi:hypothetical protein
LCRYLTFRWRFSWPVGQICKVNCLFWAPEISTYCQIFVFHFFVSVIFSISIEQERSLVVQKLDRGININWGWVKGELKSFLKEKWKLSILIFEHLETQNTSLTMGFLR